MTLLAAWFVMTTVLSYAILRPYRFRDLPRPPKDLRDAERHAVAARLNGDLDQAGYQAAMAKVAHAAPTDIEVGMVVAPDSDPRARLGLLGVALPELHPQLLCTAYMLARTGADTDLLVRALHLTRHQASAIVLGSRPPHGE